MNTSLIDDTVSKKLALMSLLCAGLVCFLHVYPSAHALGTWLMRGVFVNGICRIAVPFFFIASGYLLAAHANGAGWYARELKKRVRTLVVPYLSFCVIYLFFAAFYYQLDITIRVLLEGFGITAFFPPVKAGHLWYLRCLMGFMLLSPVLVYCARRFRWAPLAFLGLVYFVVRIPWFPYYGSVHGTYLSEGLFFFYFGIWCWFHARALWTGLSQSSQSKLGIALLLFGLLLIGGRIVALLHGCGSRFFYLNMSMTIFTVLPGVWLLMPVVKIPRSVSGMAFPVYCLHRIFIALIRGDAWEEGDCPTIFLSCLTWFGTIGASLLTALIMRSASRRAYAILFGGR